LAIILAFYIIYLAKFQYPIFYITLSKKKKKHLCYNK